MSDEHRWNFNYDVVGRSTLNQNVDFFPFFALFILTDGLYPASSSSDVSVEMHRDKTVSVMLLPLWLLPS